MRIGYIRVSTDDQTLDLQRDALERARCRRIYERTRQWQKTTTRPELEACLKSLRTGDTLVVWRLIGLMLPACWLRAVNLHRASLQGLRRVRTSDQTIQRDHRVWCVVPWEGVLASA